MIFTHTHMLRFASICPTFCRFTFSVRCFLCPWFASERERNLSTLSHQQKGGVGGAKSKRQQFSLPFYSVRCVSFVCWSFSSIMWVLLYLSIRLCAACTSGKNNRLRQSLCACAMHKNIHFFSLPPRIARMSEVAEEKEREMEKLEQNIFMTYNNAN